MGEPDHRFLWFLCKTFNKLPDDSELENMDPFMRAWMYHNWMADHNEDWQQLENQAMFIGSFSNPEAVRKFLGKDSETFSSTDEEFEETSQKIIEQNKILTEKEKRDKRRRRKIKE